jgi:hypothetical protein
MASENIPTTSQEFARWLIAQDKTCWPDALLTKAERARLSLQSMEQPAFDQSEALQTGTARDLHAFTQAYEEWKR